MYFGTSEVDMWRELSEGGCVEMAIQRKRVWRINARVQSFEYAESFVKSLLK